MRIVYCINSISHMGGIARVVVAKANALAAIEGNEVWIAYTDVDENRPEPVSPLDERVHTIDLGIRYYARDRVSRLYRLKGCTTLRRRHKEALQKALAPVRPDILISVGQSEKYLLPSLRLPGRPALVREFHYARDYRTQAESSWLGRLKARLTDAYDYGLKIHRYDAIAVLTHEDYELNWSKSGLREKVHVIPNPMTGNPDVRPSALTEKTVATVGRLSYQKNHESLIRAWAYVAERHPDWRLIIYGEGELRPQLEALIGSLGLKDSVSLPGLILNPSQKLAQSSIFAFTSRYEGFGLVLVEAAAVGVPVVSYAFRCGARDIITDGRDGFIVGLGDEKQFADRICLLIENEKLRRQTGEAALRMSLNYEPAALAQMWMNLFRQLKDKKC